MGVLGVTKDVLSEAVNIHACFSLCHTEHLNIGPLHSFFLRLSA